MGREKIRIGESEYTRDQLEFCRNGTNIYLMAKTSKYLLPIIEAYEEQGYTVVFRIPFLSKLLGSDKYKITAYR